MTASTTLPAPPDRHHCGGCQRKYNDRDVQLACSFIGRGDDEEDGDRRLAYYNCRCARPGTFTVIEDPPAVESLENLRLIYAYRKGMYQITLEARQQMNKTLQRRTLSDLYDRLHLAVAAGEELAQREGLMHGLRVRIELVELRKKKRELLREAAESGMWCHVPASLLPPPL